MNVTQTYHSERKLGDHMQMEMFAIERAIVLKQCIYLGRETMMIIC